MEVYNLIIELEVDLDHELTLGELQKRLEEQVKKWSSITHESLNPPEKVKAQANLNNTEHYKTILNDRARVKAEYEEARDSVKKKKAEAEPEIKQAIDMYWKGTASEENLKPVIQKFLQRGFSEKEIRDRVVACRPSGSSTTGPKKIDIDVRNFMSLERNLAAFGSPSVFEFLGLTDKSGREELKKTSETLQNQYRSRPISDPKNVVGKDIASLGMEIFKNESTYKKYLVWLRELPIKNLIDSNLQLIKEISIDQYLFVLAELIKQTGEGSLSVKLKLDQYLEEKGKTTNFVMDDPGASITCFCSQKARLLDGKCPDGHYLFYNCSNCGTILPRNKLVCRCKFDLNLLIRRIKSAQEARDWESLGRMIAEEGISKMDYFSSSDYKSIFQSVEDGLQKRKAEAAIIDQQYRQFCDCVSRGDISGAFQLWREEFRNRSDAQVMLDKLSSFRPDKIKITAIRDRGEKKILELKVPPGITHIGVKASGQSEPSVYTIAEIRNMLEINGQCSGVTLFGIISFAGKELQGDATIQTFTGTRSRQVIPFSLEWPGVISFISGKNLKIQIKNLDNTVLRIPETLLIGDYSLAVPFKKTHGSVLATYGPDVIEPNDVLTWEYSLKKTQGNLSVNLFAKDDPDVSYEPISGMVLSRRL